MAMILDGQVAIITGAGQGIGKTIALRLAKEGANIAIIDVNEQTANITTQAIRRLGRQSRMNVADVGDSRLVETAINTVASEFGRIDILVDNAGIEKRAPF